MVKVGDRVRTYDGHIGEVVKTYFVTGQYEMYVHIQEEDGRIWYCPASCVVENHLYRCDPAKNTQCEKTFCYLHFSDGCRHTTHPEYEAES